MHPRPSFISGASIAILRCYPRLLWLALSFLAFVHLSRVKYASLPLDLFQISQPRRRHLYSFFGPFSLSNDPSGVVPLVWYLDHPPGPRTIFRLDLRPRLPLDEGEILFLPLLCAIRLPPPLSRLARRCNPKPQIVVAVLVHPPR